MIRSDISMKERRELRAKMGSRTTRRNGTKARDAQGGAPVKPKERPRSRLSRLIVAKRPPEKVYYLAIGERVPPTGIV